MKCLILGGSGQVGRALAVTAPAGVTLDLPSHVACDIGDFECLEQYMAGSRPTLAINAAAYTAVDMAENHEAEAWRTNALGVAELAALCRRRGVRLLHLSTDFVFDGTARIPYQEDAFPDPLNVYGRSKLEGERLAQRENPDVLILRTAWVYSEQGRNFVNTMLDLMRERKEIQVVADQTGTPTFARNLARTLWRMAENDSAGIYHFSDEGEASWYEFAQAIGEEARRCGLLTAAPRIVPVTTAEYPTRARRPLYSVLDKAKIRAKIGPGQPWRDALRDMLESKSRHV